MHDVRVGDLLSHSSGVTRDSSDADFWQLQHDFPAAADLPGLAESVLGRHTRFKYSNIGFALAGRVIEAVCGEPYDAVATRDVLDVLGLRDTSTDTVGRDCAVGYSARRGGAERRPLPIPVAAGLAPATGYTSTAADLCAFADALCDGPGGVLSEDSRRVMRHVSWPGENDDQDYCLGLSHTMIGDRHVHGHGGAYPGYITSTRFVAADRLVAVALTNAIDAPAQELTSTMLALIDHAHQCEGPEQIPAGLTGRYSGLWGTCDVVRFGSRLLVLDPDLADPLERRIELDRGPGDAWTIARSSGYGSPGQQVVFDGDSCRFAGMTLRRELAW
jgi:CubicO group peptidase (beta-lactamase class C family)